MFTLTVFLKRQYIVIWYMTLGDRESEALFEPFGKLCKHPAADWSLLCPYQRGAFGKHRDID